MALGPSSPNPPHPNDRPRLRPLEAFPVEENGQRFLALRDPSGLTEAVAQVPPLVAAILQLCDGDSTRDEICELFSRRYGQRLHRDALDKVLAQLDDALLLDSDRFQAHARALHEAFEQSPVRPARIAGKGYPAEPEALGRLLDGFFAQPHGPGPAGPRTGALPRALVAPHIDLHRGGPAYAWAYRPLREAAEAPELIILLGTDHQGTERPFTLTSKHYETPLGAMRTDGELVLELGERTRATLGPAAAASLFLDEHHHRTEHSLELQMVWLRHVLGERADAVRVLPILCGSLHDHIGAGRVPSADPLVAFFVGELARVAARQRTLFVAGADLAHVGPRFGDADPLDADDRASLERRDHATLAAVARGDAEGWFQEIAREEDRRRVCGLSPIYALLQAARPGAGEVRAYGQCPADDPIGPAAPSGTSIVSIAAVVFGSPGDAAGRPAG